jgi:ferredoxin--NADP+ reductase
VIGNGNVALDVARMLALTPEELAPTDTTDPAIDAINTAGITEIVVVGRRGPVQAAWTPVEVGELGDLAGADIVVDPAELRLDPASASELEAAPPTVKRNVDHLRAYAEREPEGKPRRITLRFLRSPVAIHGDEKVEAIELVRNELVDGRAVATDERETLECGIVFRSVGYRGVGVPGVPFDSDRGTIPNKGGRVQPGLYVAGWIKRGPSGVIGTNKKDATETVELLLEDARGGRLPQGTGADLEALLTERGIPHVLYAGWEAIDAAEREAGEPRGRPRVKLRSWDELLEAARTQPVSEFSQTPGGASGREVSD